MSSLEEKKKRKRMTTTKKKKLPSVLPPMQQSTSNPYLPDDLLLSCFARVSRLYYPTLSLVSKTLPSLLASPELYKTRSSIGHTESCIYVCLLLHPDPIPRWYTLCQKPYQTLTTNTTKKLKKKKKSSGYALAKLPTPHSGPAHWSGFVTLGSDIYNIGGTEEPSSSVLIFESRSNTWREGPSMLIKRWHPVAIVLDGKIYVAGGCQDCNKSSWMEVFDPKTQSWEIVSGPGAEICGCKYLSKSAGFDGKVYIFGGGNGLAYKPKEGRWERVGWEMDTDWPWYSYAVVDNVLCNYIEGGFRWYDTNARLWKSLKGVKGLPKFPRYIARLADYGGKMAVLWERVLASTGFKDNVILCAVIALERRNDEEMWGKVEWHDTVLTVPKSCRVDFALATTV